MVVDNLTVHQTKLALYHKGEDNIIDISIGPTHNEEALEDVVEQIEESTDEEEIVLIEKRTDDIVRGETERNEEFYAEGYQEE